MEQEKVTIQNFIMDVGHYKALGIGLCDITNKYHPWLRMVPVESFRGPKVVTNLMKPENKKDSITISGNSYWTQACNAAPPFGPEPYPHYAIALTATAAAGLITLDPSIRTWADLQGKKVNLYVEGSIVRELWSIMLRFHGIYDEVDKVYLGYDEAKEALLTGAIDASYMSFSLAPPTLMPSPRLADLMEERPDDLCLLTFKKEELAELTKKTNFPIVEVPIKAQDIQRKFALKQQKEDISWVAITHFWACDKELDPVITYEIVKMLVEHRTEFRDYAPLASSWTGPEFFAACGMPIEYYHPGARKYYDEHGIRIVSP